MFTSFINHVSCFIFPYAGYIYIHIYIYKCIFSPKWLLYIYIYIYVVLICISFITNELNILNTTSLSYASPSAMTRLWYMKGNTLYVFIIIFVCFLFIHSFLAVLGLRCWAQALSSCRTTGAPLWLGPWASHCSGSSCWGARPLGGGPTAAGARGLTGFAPGLWSTGSWAAHMGLVAQQNVESSQVRDWIHVSCIDKQILYHWATREDLFLFFK